jgi:hypothetical protein
MISLKKITEKDAIDHFMLFCSLDSWGKQAEYIRNGMDFDLLYTNITDYLANSNKHSLTFIITFNALSYTGFVEYIKNIHELRKKFSNDRQLIWFDVPQLNDPDFLNPKLFPEMIVELEKAVEYMLSNREGLFNHHKGFKDFEVSKVQRLIDWIKSDTGFNKDIAMKNFYKFFAEQDKRTGKTFVDVFPELTNFWNKAANGS